MLNTLQLVRLGHAAAAYAANQTISNWLNPAAFSLPAKGTWGNLGRNIGRGPGYYEIDTSLQKRFRLTERFTLKFRAEAFNLFNHPIYDNPSGNLSSSGFGQITSTLSATNQRIMQFALKFAF